MPLTHKSKRRIANRLRTQEEIGYGVGLFNSLAWRKRKVQIRERVRRQQIRTRYHRELKKGER